MKSHENDQETVKKDQFMSKSDQIRSETGQTRLSQYKTARLESSFHRTILVNVQ